MKVQRNILQKHYCDILGDFRYVRFLCWDPKKSGVHCSLKTKFTCCFIDEQFTSLAGYYLASITVLARTQHEFTHN